MWTDRRVKTQTDRISLYGVSDLGRPRRSGASVNRFCLKSFPRGEDVKTDGGRREKRVRETLRQRNNVDYKEKLEREKSLERLERERESVGLYSPGWSFCRHSWI